MNCTAKTFFSSDAERKIVWQSTDSSIEKLVSSDIKLAQTVPVLRGYLSVLFQEQPQQTHRSFLSRTLLELSNLSRNKIRKSKLKM